MTKLQKISISKFLFVFIIALFLLSGCSLTNQMLEKSKMESTITRDANGEVEVHAIDVGQADAYLVIGNRGSTALIDCGNGEDFEVIKKYLSDHHITKLDYFILSHAHEDHAGCADKIVQNFIIDKVIISQKPSTSKFYQRFLVAINEKGKTLEIGKLDAQYALDDSIFTILGPLKTYDEMNNSSLLFRLDYKNNSMLFTGDSEYESRLDLLNSGANIDVDILKASHHGADNGVFNSEGTTRSDWLDAISPEAVILSVGKNNSYGHPSKNALKLYQQKALNIYRTDFNGSIVIHFDGQNFTVKCKY